MRRQLTILLLCTGLAVSGCGGNGGNGGMAGGTDPDPDPMPPTTPPTCMEAPNDPDCTGPTPADKMAEVKGLTAAITSTGTRPGGSDLSGDFELDPGGEIVWDGDSLEKDDKFGVEEFRNTEKTPPSIAGWRGNAYSRTVEDEKDMLTVYSNADRNRSETYTTYFSRATGDNVRPNVVTDFNADSDSDGYGTLTLAASDGNLTMQSQAALDQTIFKKPTTSNTQTIDATSDTAKKEMVGTFMGLDGHYICTLSACTVTYDDKGQVTATGGGTLTFRPTPATRRGRVPGVIKDTDYLAFGYWMQTVTQGTTTTYGINPFYAGADLYLWTDATPTTLGKATYAGNAAGAYSRRAITANGVGEPEAAGTFTADVSLTANFQGDNVAPADQYSISGSVSNFQDDQGNTISDAWALSLDQVHFGSTNDGTGEPSAAALNWSNGTTTGGGKSGAWEGAFYGKPASGATGAGLQPAGVGGSFTGNFLNGHVIGAFGATKQSGKFGTN